MKVTIDRCHNLRFTSPSTLQGIGLPLRLASIPGVSFVPGGTFTDPQGTRCQLVYAAGAVELLRLDPSVQRICLDHSDRAPLSAIYDNASLHIMYAGGPRTYTPSADDPSVWYLRAAGHHRLPVSLRRVDVDTVTARFPALTLADTYHSSSTALSATDQAKVDTAYRTAYCGIADRAHAAGCFVQPVMACYQLIDRDGTVVYTSVPVMIAPDAGAQMLSLDLSLGGTGLRAVDATSLTATIFRIGVESDTDALAREGYDISQVRVLVSPQFHPLGAALPGQSVRTGASSGTALTMRTSLPGTQLGEEVAKQGSRLRHLADAVLCMAGRALLPSIPGGTCSADLTRIDALLEAYRRATPNGHALPGPWGGGTFTAAAVACGGDTVAWGNISALPAPAPLPAALLNTRQLSGTQSAASIAYKMADGSVEAVSSTLDASGVSTYSPLVCYPSPRATVCTLRTGAYGFTVPLAPSADARWSYWVDPSLKPLRTVQTFAGPHPATSRAAAVQLPGVVALAPASTPLAPVATAHTGVGDIRAIVPGLRQANSFTVPSARYWVCGSAGTASLSYAAASGRARVNLVDTRSVPSREAVTALPGGFAALLGGELVSFTGSKAVTLRQRVPHNTATLARGIGRDELWLLPGPGGGTACIHSPYSDVLATFTLPGISAAATGAGGLLLATAEGDILDAGAPPQEVAPTAVALAYTVPGPFKAGSRGGTALNAGGCRLTGTLSLSAATLVTPSPGHTVLYTLATRRFTALTPAGPLTATARVPACASLHVRFDATTPCPTSLTISLP